MGEREGLQEVCARHGLLVNIAAFPAQALGYRLLRKLVETELLHQRSAGPAAVERWIGSASFQRGFELFLGVVQRGRIMCAPALSDKQAWDLLMVIEPLVRADAGLAADRSLTSLLAEQERHLLHHAVWQGKHVYGLLQGEQDQRRQQSPPPHHLSISSPGKALLAITLTASSPDGGVAPLEFFFRKLLRHTAVILQQLVSALGLSGQSKQASWDLFVLIVEGELEHQLLLHRHLFTVVACTLYSVARLFDEDRSFAQIIAQLQRHYPAYDDAWFRSIRPAAATDSHGDTVDIVDFYNSIFLGRLRGTIYALRRDAPTTPTKAEGGGGNGGGGFAPFPALIGTCSIARNVRLDVSVSPRRWELPGRQSPGQMQSPPTCIKILGNLGVRRLGEWADDDDDISGNDVDGGRDASRPLSPPNRRVYRRLDF